MNDEEGGGQLIRRYKVAVGTVGKLTGCLECRGILQAGLAGHGGYGFVGLACFKIFELFRQGWGHNQEVLVHVCMHCGHSGQCVHAVRAEYRDTRFLNEYSQNFGLLSACYQVSL